MVLPSKANHRNDDVKRVYITATGIYQISNSNNYSSICFSKNAFEGYKYIAIKANKEYATRVHILKNVPKKNNEHVQYSDYYKESILVGKGMKLDIVIPQDAKFIYVLNSAEGHNNKPDYINFYTEDSLSNSEIPETQILSRRAANGGDTQKFMHWNIGNFSQGKYPYSNIKGSNYKVKLDGFSNFINTYCPDCHYLLNEYNETFAKVNGNSVSTPTVLFSKRINYKDFPRTTSSGYNKLAIFGREGLLSYRYSIFESLKGVKNSNGTLEYGTGYCISQYAIGETILYVMSLHAPNKITTNESNALYEEILSIVSGYENCVLVGDFNRTIASNFSVLTNAGFKILNDKSITHPSNHTILDWVLYRCKDVTLSNFRFYKEAVDSNGELLSDHLPLSFTVTYNR